MAERQALPRGVVVGLRQTGPTSVLASAMSPRGSIPASAADGELSVTVTSRPARAATSAMPEPIRPQPTTPTLSITFATMRRPKLLTCRDLARPRSAPPHTTHWRGQLSVCQLSVTVISVAFTAAHSSRPTFTRNASAAPKVISAVSWTGPSRRTRTRSARWSTSTTDARHAFLWTAFRPRRVQRHGLWADHCDRRSVDVCGRDDKGCPAVDCKDPTHHRTGQQVDADELGHVRRPRMGGDLGERPVLHDVAVLDDHDPIRQRVGIDRIVCHQYRTSPELRRDGDAARGAPPPVLRRRVPPTVRPAARASAREQALAPTQPAGPDRLTVGADVIVRCPGSPPCAASAEPPRAQPTFRHREPSGRTPRSRAPTCAERAGIAGTSRPHDRCSDGTNMPDDGSSKIRRAR